MRLSRKKAIELCIELWEWLAKTGAESKSDWPGWQKYGYVTCNCWFCEYQEQQYEKYKPDNKENKEGFCRYCPLTKIKVDCMPSNNGSLYLKWKSAKTPRTRKKYAKLFLGQIMKCK